MATQLPEPLTEDEVQALAEKLRRQGQVMSPRDRLLASEAVKSGLQSDSDEVQGYGMLVSVLDEQITSAPPVDAEQMTEEEFRAFMERLQDLTLELSPKEQAFMARAFRNGVMAMQTDDVTGYYYYTQNSSALTVYDVTVATAATAPIPHNCPPGMYWDPSSQMCVYDDNNPTC